MVKYDIFSDFLLEESDNLLPELALEIVQAVETILSNSVTTNLRKAYLMELAGVMRSDENKMISPVQNPLTHNQLVSCVKKGLVGSFINGEILLDQIRKLAHSLEGMNELSEVMVETPENERATCWQHAFDPPPTYQPVNLEKIFKTSSIENVYQILNDLVEQLLNVISPQRLILAFGTRGVSGKQEPAFVLDGKLNQSSNVKEIISSLQTGIGKINDIELRTAMGKIPWNEITKLVDPEIKWDKLLGQIGDLIRSRISTEELIRIEDGIDNDPVLADFRKDELILLRITLKSIYFHG